VIMRLLNLRLTLTLCVRLTHYNIMDGWMDGGVDVWVGGWVDGWMDI